MGIPFRSGASRSALARCAHERGHLDEAIEIAEGALAVSRETGAPGIMADALLHLGQLRHEAGDDVQARTHLEEARAIADEVGISAPDAEIHCQLAVWPGGDATAARALFEERNDVLEAECRLRCRLLLWQATGDADVLEAAWMGLSRMRDHAPREAREAMVEKVSTHRAIAEAWRDFESGRT